jgi:plastocyanin
VVVTGIGLGLAVWDMGSGRGIPATGRAYAAGSVVIEIKNFQFVPPAVTITRGQTVRWINADVANHQVTSGVVEADRPRPDGRIASPLLFRGDSFSATFRVSGNYPYYCGIHPFMRGALTVK